MSYFQNILVGVDLSHGDWMASADGETPSHFACEWAVDLAAANKAAGNASQVHFLAALDLDEKTKRLLDEDPDNKDTVVCQAQEALKHQVAAAAKQGVSSDSEVMLGRSRVEIPRAGNQGKYDVVMIGSRGHGALSNLLMGSTSLELLHLSEQPVWIVKAHAPGPPKRILVATDFSPVCAALFERGLELAQLFDAELHVMHVVKEVSRPWLQFAQATDEKIQQAHDQAVAEATAKLAELATRPDVMQLDKKLVTHVKQGLPSKTVAEATQELEIDLLLMGAVASSGVPGMMFGTTASKLLPNLTCSLLTMRPTE